MARQAGSCWRQATDDSDRSGILTQQDSSCEGLEACGGLIVRVTSMLRLAGTSARGLRTLQWAPDPIVTALLKHQAP